MYKSGDRIKVTQSNGLTFRNGPNILGNIIRSIPDRTELVVLNVVKDSLTWLNVTYENIEGWIVAENGVGDVNVKVLPKPKQRRYRKKAKKTAEE
jgi:hypothetical protein